MIFTIEAVYVVAVVLGAMMLLMASLKQVETPNYDTIQSLKAAHDIGEARFRSAPDGFNFTVGDAAFAQCLGDDVVLMPQYGDLFGVCMK